MEVLRKKERQYETQFTTKIDGFLSFITLCTTKFRVLVFCFSYFMDNSDVNKMLNLDSL
jgi:hypothetical protein